MSEINYSESFSIYHVRLGKILSGLRKYLCPSKVLTRLPLPKLYLHFE